MRKLPMWPCCYIKRLPKRKTRKIHYDPQIYRKIRLPIDFNTEIEYLKNILNYCLTRLDTLDEITPENSVPRDAPSSDETPPPPQTTPEQKMKPQSRILSPSYNVQLQMMMKWVGERSLPAGLPVSQQIQLRGPRVLLKVAEIVQH